ncbi:8215_t:CDS:1, partial [Gigaspora margarita]
IKPMKNNTIKNDNTYEIAEMHQQEATTSATLKSAHRLMMT